MKKKNVLKMIICFLILTTGCTQAIPYITPTNTFESETTAMFDVIVTDEVVTPTETMVLTQTNQLAEVTNNGLDSLDNLTCPTWDWDLNQHIYLIAPGEEGQGDSRESILLVNADINNQFLLEYTGMKRVTGYFWHPDENAIGFVALGNIDGTLELLDLESCSITSRMLSQFEFEILRTILFHNFGNYQVNNPRFPMIPLYAFRPNDTLDNLYFVRADWGFDQTNWVSPNGHHLVLFAGYSAGRNQPFPIYSLEVMDLITQDKFILELPDILNHHTLTWLLSWSNDSSTLAVDNFLYHLDTQESELLDANIFPPYEWSHRNDKILYNGSYPPFFYSYYNPSGVFTDQYDYNSSPCIYHFSDDQTTCFNGLRDFHINQKNSKEKISFYNLKWLAGGDQIGYSFYTDYNYEQRGGGYCVYTISKDQTHCITDEISDMHFKTEGGELITKDVVHALWSKDETFIALMAADSCPLCQYAIDRQIFITTLEGDILININEVTFPGLWKPSN